MYLIATHIPIYTEGTRCFTDISWQRDFLYKTTAYYRPDAERAMRWDDPTLAITWPDVGVPLQLSAKDKAAPPYVDRA
jgi:dTDP-4-dehydrorhamnose 3,5-epimerase